MTKTGQKVFQIAIDGPVAAGKGTVSKLLAKQLGFLYVDTGATYRAAALMAMRMGLDLEALDKMERGVVEELVKKMEATKLEMHVPRDEEVDGRLITVVVDGEDVSWVIRDQEVSKNVPVVAKIGQLREVMVRKQQKIAANQSVVMEGRDITYRVLPNAQLKVYLDASLEERAVRRVEQLREQGLEVSVVEMQQQIEERDRTDMERASDPLKVVTGAWVVDTTGLSIEEVVEKIVERVREVQKVQEVEKATSD